MNGSLQVVRRAASPVALAMVVGLLEGCATGKCLEWGYQTVQVEVCDRRSNTGWCAARHTETRSQQVCVRREQPSETTAVSGGSGARAAGPKDLSNAAAGQDLEAVRVALAEGPNVDRRNQYGTAPLHSAAQNGNVEIAKLLLDAGASVRVTNDRKQTPLHVAAGWGHVKVAELLLAKGADPNAEDEQGETPLHSAAVHGRAAYSIPLLIRHGAKVDTRNKEGSTPLTRAALHADLATVKALLDAGADPNIAGKYRQTPLGEAKRARKKENAELLMKYGAK